MHAALAELEGALIGAPELGAPRRAALSETIGNYLAGAERALAAH